jgi:hypothetical protein
MSACIIPVGPEFQDPPPTLAAPPWIVSAMPVDVSVPYTITMPTEFTAKVADATASVTIYYQWVFGYPPEDSNVTHLLGDPLTFPTAANEQPVQIMSPSISCNGIHPPPGSGPSYSFALILGDAPFSGNILGQFDDGSGMAPTYIWPIDMPCPATTVTP